MDINKAISVLSESVSKDLEMVGIKELALSVLSDKFKAEFESRDTAIKIATDAQLKTQSVQSENQALQKENETIQKQTEEAAAEFETKTQELESENEALKKQVEEITKVDEVEELSIK